MKTFNIELQRIKSMSNSHGLIHARVDATVQAASARDEPGEPSTTVSMSLEDARVFFMLLKAQFAEVDARKARSQR